MQLAAVAALCVQYEAEFRPNMSIVVKALSALLASRHTQTPAPPLAVDSWCIELTEVSSFFHGYLIIYMGQEIIFDESQSCRMPGTYWFGQTVHSLQYQLGCKYDRNNSLDNAHKGSIHLSDFNNCMKDVFSTARSICSSVTMFIFIFQETWILMQVGILAGYRNFMPVLGSNI